MKWEAVPQGVARRQLVRNNTDVTDSPARQRVSGAETRPLRHPDVVLPVNAACFRSWFTSGPSGLMLTSLTLSTSGGDLNRSLTAGHTLF